MLLEFLLRDSSFSDILIECTFDIKIPDKLLDVQQYAMKIFVWPIAFYVLYVMTSWRNAYGYALKQK